MSRNGKGVDTTIVINLDQLKKDKPVFKEMYTQIEAKRGITFKSLVCFDLTELADAIGDGDNKVSLTYNNKALVKVATDLLTKLDIQYTITK